MSLQINFVVEPKSRVEFLRNVIYTFSNVSRLIKSKAEGIFPVESF